MSTRENETLVDCDLGSVPGVHKMLFRKRLGKSSLDCEVAFLAVSGSFQTYVVDVVPFNPLSSNVHVSPEMSSLKV
jgi:hypothetical protein